MLGTLMPTALVTRFGLDPTLRYLNHGSFGACLREVLAAQDRVRARMEADPLRFFERDAVELLDAARTSVSTLVRADRAGMVYVRNATQAVNSVAQSFAFAPGDEILTTDHAYPACVNALVHWGGRAGARVVTAKVPFPLASTAQVTDAVLAAVTPRTRLAMIDHVTSPTGLVFPIADITRELERRGVAVLVDGAHAVGMVPVDLGALGASYYTSNLHKWLCAPKGCAFLHVRQDRRADLHPTVISHGLGKGLLAEFDWTGTDDPSPWLVVPEAIAALEALEPGGLGSLMAANRALALEAQGWLSEALGIERPAPPDAIGALVAVPLPPREDGELHDPLREALEDTLRARVPFFPWPAPPERLLRVSVQRYVAGDDLRAVADFLRDTLRR